MRLIDGDALYERFAKLEDTARTKYHAAATEEERKKWNTVLAERVSYRQDVADAPTIEPRTGHWIESNPMNSADVRLITCSECGNTYIVGMSLLLEDWADGRNYCIRCGADMREPEVSDGICD